MFRCYAVLTLAILLSFFILHLRNSQSNSTQRQTESSTNETCPKGTILYTNMGGNTGNLVWEYLSLLAVYKLFPEKQFLPYVPDSIIQSLGEIFEPLSLPPLSTLPAECLNLAEAKTINPTDTYATLEKLPNNTKVVKLGMYSARYEEVTRYGLDKVRREFRYKPEHVVVAMETLNELKQTFQIPRNVTPVYVGMHFRGTDYTYFLKRNYPDTFRGPPTHEFYSKAMRYFTKKYNWVIFILISTDLRWIAKNAQHLKGDVAVNPYGNNKIKDMALLSHCNHSVINYGTFSTTMAVLAGGTTIVYDLKVPQDHRGSTLAMGIAELLNNWVLFD